MKMRFRKPVYLNGRLKKLEERIPPPVEPDIWMDYLHKVTEIVYDEALTEEEPTHQIEDIEEPEPTTKDGRQLKLQLDKIYGGEYESGLPDRIEQ